MKIRLPVVSVASFVITGFYDVIIAKHQMIAVNLAKLNYSS